jgi:hypothetical protein
VLATLSFTFVESPTKRIARPMALASPLLTCAALVFFSAVLAQPKPPPEQQTGVVVHGHP